jgi:hypothetical protein
MGKLAALFPYKKGCNEKADLSNARLRVLVRTQFQVLFHSPHGVLLTFPSRYLFSIDRKIYLALEGGPSGFNQGFSCPDLLDTKKHKVCFTLYTRLSLSLAGLSNPFYLLSKFLTLYKLVVALVRRTEIHLYGMSVLVIF